MSNTDSRQNPPHPRDKRTRRDFLVGAGLMAGAGPVGGAGSLAHGAFTSPASVAVAVRKGTWGGQVDVLVDGQLKLNNYDTYSPSQQFQQVIYENTSLPAGQHTVRLVATGQANPASNHTNAMFDYFEVS